MLEQRFVFRSHGSCARVGFDWFLPQLYVGTISEDNRGIPQELPRCNCGTGSRGSPGAPGAYAKSSLSQVAAFTGACQSILRWFESCDPMMQWSGACVACGDAPILGAGSDCISSFRLATHAWRPLGTAPAPLEPVLRLVSSFTEPARDRNVARWSPGCRG
jgi:hypothetical protein